MSRFTRFIVRLTAFLRKEIFEVLRQPRLIASLVLGPFLILLLFGIGYRNDAPRLRTLFVVDEGSPLAVEIDRYAKDLGEQLIFEGITEDLDGALARLRRDEIDLVAVAPEDAYRVLEENRQAVFTLYHNEIDPFQADYIRYFGKIYIDEVNRRLLQSATAEGQDTLVNARADVSAARASAERLRVALEDGNVAEAQREKATLDAELTQLDSSAGTTIDALSNVQRAVGEPSEPLSGLRQSITAAREETTAIEIEEGQSSYAPQVVQVQALEARLALIDTNVGTIRPISPRVLVSPFQSETQNIIPNPPTLNAYFAPSVIALLLQHLAITFAALSIVREQQIGTIELFRVSPISAGETLVGKYTSYMLFGTVIAAALTALVFFIPLMPNVDGVWEPLARMNGSWLNYWSVILALLFASIGLGFIISLIVDTDSQAVQYAMIVLLTSIFFSGFFLALSTLWQPIHVVSWALPVTYAIQLLQDIAPRGVPGNALQFGGLIAMGVLFYFVSWFLLGRRMARE